jgi:hypothetical protein
MKILYFAIFGFLSSLIGNILGMLTNLVTLLLTPIGIPIGKINESIGIGYLVFTSIIGYVLTYLAWAIGATTGLLIAAKYSGESTLLYVVFVIIIAFFNFRVWKIFLDQQKKNKALLQQRHETVEFIAEIGDNLIFYAIIIPLIVFSIKQNWATPYFDFVFSFIENWLPK